MGSFLKPNEQIIATTAIYFSELFWLPAVTSSSSVFFNIINFDNKNNNDRNSFEYNPICNNGRNQNTDGLATSRYELSNSTRRRFTIQTIHSDS